MVKILLDKIKPCGAALCRHRDVQHSIPKRYITYMPGYPSVEREGEQSMRINLAAGRRIIVWQNRACSGRIVVRDDAKN